MKTRVSCDIKNQLKLLKDERKHLKFRIIYNGCERFIWKMLLTILVFFFLNSVDKSRDEIEEKL